MVPIAWLTAMISPASSLCLDLIFSSNGEVRVGEGAGVALVFPFGCAEAAGGKARSARKRLAAKDAALGRKIKGFKVISREGL
jgi:hypothetical protein